MERNLEQYMAGAKITGKVGEKSRKLLRDPMWKV